jgi:hypothetical protein
MPKLVSPLSFPIRRMCMAALIVLRYCARRSMGLHGRRAALIVLRYCARQSMGLRGGRG